MHGLIRHVSVNRAKFLALLMSSLFSTSIALGKAQSGQGGTNAYQINGKVVTLEEISEENKAAFYEIQKKTYATVEETAKSQYLEDYWKKLAHKRGVTVEKAEADFMKSKMKLQESEIKATLERFKDHPQLSKISKDEQRKKIVEFLEQQKKVSVIQTILLEAMSSNKLVILYPEPEEPV